MLNVGTPELLVILVVALVVLGPDKLPAAARQIGRAVAEVRRMSSGFQAELRDALQEPVPGTPSAAPPPPAASDPASVDREGDAPAGDGRAGTQHADPAPG